MWSPQELTTDLGADPPYLAAKLPLVIWRGYATTCTSLRTVPDRLGCRASWQAPPHPVALYSVVRASDRSPGWGARSPGLASYFGVDGSGPDGLNLSGGNPPLSRGRGLIRYQSDHDDYAYFVKELLCQVVMGRILVLKRCLSFWLLVG
jgi:hypothetical protein